MLHFLVSPDDGDPPKETSPITIPSVSLYEREAKVNLGNILGHPRPRQGGFVPGPPDPVPPCAPDLLISSSGLSSCLLEDKRPLDNV